VNDYASAIRQAAAFLTIKTNAVPSSAWSSQLYDAQITLSYPLSWIEEK
jgi:hypothetical protein